MLICLQVGDLFIYVLERGITAFDQGGEPWTLDAVSWMSSKQWTFRSRSIETARACSDSASAGRDKKDAVGEHVNGGANRKFRSAGSWSKRQLSKDAERISTAEMRCFKGGDVGIDLHLGPLASGWPLDLASGRFIHCSFIHLYCQNSVSSCFCFTVPADVS